MVVINYFWFVFVVFCEIVGCYVFYFWLWLGKSVLWVLFGLFSLILFVLLLICVEVSYVGCVYVVYGGIYVVVLLFWLVFVECLWLLWSDWLGVVLCVVGVSVVLFGLCLF